MPPEQIQRVAPSIQRLADARWAPPPLLALLAFGADQGPSREGVVSTSTLNWLHGRTGSRFTTLSPGPCPCCSPVLELAAGVVPLVHPLTNGFPLLGGPQPRCMSMKPPVGIRRTGPWAKNGSTVSAYWNGPPHRVWGRSPHHLAVVGPRVEPTVSSHVRDEHVV
jgi:hypothetical protein